MNLERLDIVRVVGQRMRHYDKEGQIVGFDPSNRARLLCVWFGRECDYLLEPEQRLMLTDKSAFIAPTEIECVSDIRTYNYAPFELQKVAEWSVETLAERYFHKTYVRCEIPNKPFISRVTRCEVKGCSELSTKRIVYNFLGTVCFADVCDKHSEKHGKCTEEPLPIRIASRVY